MLKGEVEWPFLYNVIRAKEGRKLRRDYGLVSEGRVTEGPVVIVANHRHDKLDVPSIGVCANRQLWYLGKAELGKGLRGRLMSKVGATYVERGQSADGRRALYAGSRILEAGHALVVFGEATSKNRGLTLGNMENGPAILALRNRTLIQPVGIGGTENPANADHIHIIFGEPFRPAEYVGDMRLRQAAPLIMDILRPRLQDLYSLAQERSNSPAS